MDAHMTPSLDALAGQPATRPDHTCGVCWALQELSPKQSGLLRQALDNPGVKLREIVDALSPLGHIVNRDTVSRHRRRECKGQRQAAA